ncbi:MAG: hypothetical protein LBH65_03115, partial [Desulfovibrio sp.]|nr:hypothetical protein [Desulfovibrio sp.]
MRSLVFGPMPLRATPESHLAAGPWCFAGQEENFPGWDGDPGKQGRFPLPPDPYPTGDDVATAARSANAEVVRLARYFGEQGNKIHGRSLSDAFWLTFLGPHLLLCTHMLLERQQRVLDLIALYGAMPLRVDILPPDIPFSFADSRDFMLRGVQDTRFNHYIYSRMLESLAPAAWQLIVLPAQAPRTAAPRHKTPARARWRERLGRLLRDLPFPRYKGFSLWQSCLLSLAVLSNGRKRDERGLDFSAYCGEPPVWRFAAEEMI